MKHLNLLGQRSMDKRNGDRSFTDCRRHALGVAASNIADGEHSGPRRFEQIRRALEGPLRRGEIFRCQVRSAFDEAFRVERDVTIQPTRIRLRARFDVPDGRAESCREAAVDTNRRTEGRTNCRTTSCTITAVLKGRPVLAGSAWSQRLDQAAVDHEVRARDIPRAIAGQEEHKIGDLVGTRESPRHEASL